MSCFLHPVNLAVMQVIRCQLLLIPGNLPKAERGDCQITTALFFLFQSLAWLKNTMYLAKGIFGRPKKYEKRLRLMLGSGSDGNIFTLYIFLGDSLPRCQEVLLGNQTLSNLQIVSQWWALMSIFFQVLSGLSFPENIGWLGLSSFDSHFRGLLHFSSFFQQRKFEQHVQHIWKLLLLAAQAPTLGQQHYYFHYFPNAKFIHCQQGFGWRLN